MMVTMTLDATGHGTQDAGHVARPVDRASAPEAATGVPSNQALAERDTGRGTQDTPRDTVPPTPQDTSDPDPQDVPQDTAAEQDGNWLTRTARRYAARRDASRRSAEQAKMIEDAARAARDAERDRQRDALSRTAANRRASRAVTREARNETIAPIPAWMKIVGVWIDRTFGALPLLAPLIVSGYFTMNVFTDDPVSTPWLVALAITAALEGGVWKLSRIYEATLLEGDSTVGIRVAIGLYLALISGLIYGHAYYLARQDSLAAGSDNVVVDWTKWAPAAGVAAMSALGVLVWSKQARYMHRKQLRDAGQVDPRAPKFATLAWVLHFPETFGALRHSVKYRIGVPGDAVDDLRLYRAAGRPPIWPIPEGFAWINGTLFQVDPITGHQERDAKQDTSTARDTARRDATADAGQRAAGRTSGTQDTGGTTRTGHSGTQDTPDRQDSNGTAGTDHGTDDAAGDGTQDTGGTRDGDGTRDGTHDETDDFAEILKFSEHLIAVTDAYPNWQHGALPSVRKITAAIDQYRRRRDGGSYNSNATSAEVQKQLNKLRRRPELLDVMKVQQEGPTG